MATPTSAGLITHPITTLRRRSLGGPTDFDGLFIAV